MELPSSDYVYRRLPPNHCKDGIGIGAFRMRETDTSLSVFSTIMVSPKGVIQNCIDKQDASKAESFFKRYGSTPEEMIGKGWRIAVIPISSFTSRGCIVEPPDEEGHCDVIIPNLEDYESELAALSNEAILLDASQCLSEKIVDYGKLD